MRLIVLSLFLSLALAASAHAQTAEVENAAPHQHDEGFRLYAAAGYPSIMALGFGWKSKSGVEALGQVGGAAVWAGVFGTSELSISYDFVRARWGSLRSGLAASLLHTHFFVIDCYEGETCEDFVQTLWLTSPRAGIRLRLDPRKQYGALPYVDLAAGPQIGLCRGDCERGQWVVNAAVVLKGVLDFRPRQK